MNRILSIFVVLSMVLGGLIGGQLLFSIPVTAPDPEYLPDLTISPQDISLSPGTPIAGEPVIINATIWNVGNTDATDVEINFFEEDALIGSEIVDIPVNGTWKNNTVDKDGNVGLWTSIAVDSENGVHICYRDSVNDDLKYAYKSEVGNWVNQTVDWFGDVGSFSSITVDRDDGVHISYRDDTVRGLKYAYKPDGNDWTIQTVDSLGDVGQFCSIAIDGANGIHISYLEHNIYNLKYAYKPIGGSWTNYTIDSAGNVGLYSSIVVDDANGVHISYYDLSNNDLKYSYKPDGGSWANYTIDTAGDEYTSIDVDSENNPHISYYDNINRDLKYSYKPNGSSWIIQTIDTSSNVGDYSSICVDGINGVHISYHDNDNNALKYAYRPDGDDWTTYFVDYPGNVGFFSSIATDSANGVHISYQDQGNLDLKYANLIAPPGNIQVSIPWTPTTAGIRNITVKIDENTEIEEIDETNNEATAVVNVEPGPLAIIEINPSSVTLEINETQQFIASGYDAYGNEVSISPTWDVNGGGTIDQSGLYSTNYPGTWTVYTNESGISGIATVIVIVNGSSDLDSDGMLDWWEIEYGLDPFEGSDAGIDPDLDYLTNLQEFLNFSNPNNNETDGDSLSDGFEVIFSKTNASNWDTNGNGIGDGLEFIQYQGYLGWIGSLPDDWIGMTISWENYTIYVKTNSSVLEGEFDKEERELKIKVSGPEGTQGVTEIDIPKTLCEPEDIEIQLDGELINYTLTQDDTYYYIHIEYYHSIHELSATFGQPSEITEQNPDDDKGLLEDWSFIGMIIALIIIVILLIIITGNRSGKEDIGVQELPPEQLSKLLEKQHSEGKITDDTFNDAKSLLEKYGGE